MSARNYTSTATVKTVGGAGLNAGVTTIAVSPNKDSLPTVYPYTLVIDPDTASEEIVTVRSLNTGDILNITRGQDGTTDVSHDAGAVVKHMITPRDLQEPQNHIEAASAYTIKNDGENTGVTGPTISKSVHGIASGEGTVVGTLKPQTLTNKTINLTNNTLIGTVAQFNDALSDADFATTALLEARVPVGSITMWALATAPTGWQICNGDAAATAALSAVLGTANVPDMRGFVPAGFKTGDDAFGTLKGTGGSKTSTAVHTHGLASHTHTTNIDHGHSASGSTSIDTQGSHTHATNIEIAGSLANGGIYLLESNTTPRGAYMQPAGDHSHNASTSVTVNGTGTDNKGSSGPSDNTSGPSSVGATNGNLQPYFTLNFIIKH